MPSGNEKTAEWLAAEQAFGCTFASFIRIHAGNSSLNYRADTPDGHKYFVKFCTPGHVKRIFGLMGAISSPLIPGIAFNGATGKYGKWGICAIEWCEGGENIPPHRLTTELLKAITDGYGEISQALSSVDSARLEIREGTAEAAKECGLELRPIHGDFHYMNYFMRDGRISACYDLETLRLGIPTEDMLRIFVHEIERTRCWNFHRISTIYRKLTEMVRISPYPKKAWLAAVRLYRDRKIRRRIEKAKFPLFVKIDNWLRSPYYRRLLHAVEEA